MVLGRLIINELVETGLATPMPLDDVSKVINGDVGQAVNCCTHSSHLHCLRRLSSVPTSTLCRKNDRPTLHFLNIVYKRCKFELLGGVRNLTHSRGPILKALATKCTYNFSPRLDVTTLPRNTLTPKVLCFSPTDVRGCKKNRFSGSE